MATVLNALFTPDTNPGLPTPIVGAWVLSGGVLKTVSGDLKYDSGGGGNGSALHLIPIAGSWTGATFIGATAVAPILIQYCVNFTTGDYYCIYITSTSVAISKSVAGAAPVALATLAVVLAANDELSFNYEYTTGIATVYRNGAAVLTAPRDVDYRDNLGGGLTVVGVTNALRTSYVVDVVPATDVLLFFRTYQHLLPRARAWSLTADKSLRKFFRGLSGLGKDARYFIDRIWLDIFPATTRELSAGEWQFNLPTVPTLTTAERRTRLAGAWQALGGQDPRYIQDMLQAAGFDVYVHEWWVPGSEPALNTAGAATARDPHTYLRENSAGEPVAGKGYALVNRLLPTAPVYLTGAGEPLMEAGEAIAEAGNFDYFHLTEMNYTLPTNPAVYPYFVYIGAAVFPNLASIPAARQLEFEALCLKICPAHTWIGILVTYP